MEMQAGLDGDIGYAESVHTQEAVTSVCDGTRLQPSRKITVGAGRDYGSGLP